jgi:hypothetical protein
LTSGGTVPSGLGLGGGVGVGTAGQVTIYQSAPATSRGPARSAYLQQVRRIAPPDPPGLIGRADELAELAAFCVEPDRGLYAWCRAGPWAGKSALMSTFVLRPPPEVARRARVVSFFVTARLAAQDTREAFTQVLLEQLADLTGEELPAALPEATRDAWLLDLMARAAAMCQNAGGRLVLVVDGLDEDRGVTTGPRAHSIAGLLPADPPTGMRVIVAGRPNPPVPDDVPDWHPLRDPAIVRQLEDSAARGGHRAAEQAGTAGPAGRQPCRAGPAGAAGRRARWPVRPGPGRAHGHPAVGHRADPAHRGRADLPAPGQQLDARCQPGGLRPRARGAPGVPASRYLGPRRLAAYQDRLHAWAGGYRDRGWPSGTPQYLLGGYFRLLESLGDVVRMTAYASDTARHDRMLDLSGGDAAAYAEVRTALDLIAARDMPDVAAALRLACHRDQLAARNAKVPRSLPAVWATLGQVTRAQALAASITEDSNQDEALAWIAVALATAGDRQRAGAIAASLSAPGIRVATLALIAKALSAAGHLDQATAVAEGAGASARLIADPVHQAAALAHVAMAFASVGHREHAAASADAALALACSLADPDARARALYSVVEALQETLQREAAAKAAREISDPSEQAWALVQVAGALEMARHYPRAQAAARSIADASVRAGTLAWIAASLADDGLHEDAADAADAAEEAARALPDVTDRAEELAYGTLSQALAGTRFPDRAEALAYIALTRARAGCHEQAVATARDAELARSAAPQDQKATTLAAATRALAAAGQPGQALIVAQSVIDSYQRGQAVEAVAAELARAGKQEEATALARSQPDPKSMAQVLAAAAEEIARSGEPERVAVAARLAEEIARTGQGPYDADGAVRRIAEAMAATGQYEAAAGAAWLIKEGFNRWQTFSEIARSATGAGHLDQAERAARSITDPADLAEALAAIAAGLARAGDHQRASAIASRAEAVARSFTPEEQERALAEIAAMLAAAQRFELALSIAGWISDPGERVRTLTAITKELAAAGQLAEAKDVIGTAELAASSIPAGFPDGQSIALINVTDGLGAAGHHDHAEATARSIADPQSQVDALAAVAAGLARAGERERAVTVAREAERIAAELPDPYRETDALPLIAGALAAAGHPDEAEELARSVDSSGLRAGALAAIAEGLARAGWHELPCVNPFTVRQWLAGVV